MNEQHLEFDSGANHFGQGSPANFPGYFSPDVAEFVWFDRELVPIDKATDQFNNPSKSSDPGVFEGIRCYDTADTGQVS